MKKLRTLIQYECTSSFKYIWLFYGVEFIIVAFIFAVVGIRTGNLGEVSVKGLEMNTFIFIGVVGVEGFKEDFKMLIQNGFTRRYIFFGAISLFVFVSGVMALVDTITGKVLRGNFQSYESLFGNMYGYEHSIFLNWVWLFFVNMIVCSLFYMAALVINKIGKTASIYLGLVIGGIIIMVSALFRSVLSKEFIQEFIEAATKGMGFISDGTVNFVYPVLIFLLCVCALSTGAYVVICRTELKG